MNQSAMPEAWRPISPSNIKDLARVAHVVHQSEECGIERQPWVESCVTMPKHREVWLKAGPVSVAIKLHPINQAIVPHGDSVSIHIVVEDENKKAVFTAHKSTDDIRRADPGPWMSVLYKELHGWMGWADGMGVFIRRGKVEKDKRLRGLAFDVVMHHLKANQ